LVPSGDMRRLSPERGIVIEALRIPGAISP